MKIETRSNLWQVVREVDGGIQTGTVIPVPVESIADLARWCAAIRGKPSVLMWAKITESCRDVFYEVLEICEFRNDVKKRLDFKKSGYLAICVSGGKEIIYFASNKYRWLGQLDILYE